MGKRKLREKTRSKPKVNKFRYGRYKPINRLSSDQVPYQNMHVKRTVDVKGITRVYLKPSKLRKRRRFCTLQITVRASDPQPFPLMIIFRGTPRKDDASIPKMKGLREEAKHYDPRGIYAFDKTAYLTDGPTEVWYHNGFFYI